MPGPPPKGLSSTLWCLSRENLRMSWIYMSITRSWRARLIILSLKYESKIWGKIVRMSKRMWKLYLKRGEESSFPFSGDNNHSQSSPRTEMVKFPLGRIRRILSWSACVR